MTPEPSGFCQCGCGQPTKIAPVSYAGRGWIKGAPFRFLRGHATKGRGRMQYPRIPIAGDWQDVHRVRAEQALGKPLPPGAQVHHVDGSRDADTPLVICQDYAYHRLLHARTRIVKAGGNPNTDAICGRCKRVKTRAEFYPSRTKRCGIMGHCKTCAIEYKRQWQSAAR